MKMREVKGDILLRVHRQYREIKTFVDDVCPLSYMCSPLLAMLLQIAPPACYVANSPNLTRSRLPQNAHCLDPLDPLERPPFPLPETLFDPRA